LRQIAWIGREQKEDGRRKMEEGRWKREETHRGGV